MASWDCFFCHIALGKPHLASCKYNGLVQVVHTNKVEEGTMEPTFDKKLDLNAQGSRYDHYMELKEVFMTALDIIERRAPNLQTDGDKKMKAKLEPTIELIDRRIRYLADYDSKIYGVNREIEAAHRKLELTGGRDTRVDPNITVE